MLCLFSPKFSLTRQVAGVNKHLTAVFVAINSASPRGDTEPDYCGS